MSKWTLELTDENFKKEVKDTKGVWLVDFWATWCAPCKMVAPVVEEIAQEYKGKIKVGKLDVDDNPEAANKYEVMSIPTLIVFKDGKEEKRIVGAVSKEQLKEKLKAYL